MRAARKLLWCTSVVVVALGASVGVVPAAGATAGPGVASAASAATPAGSAVPADAGAPGMPAAPTAVAGDAQATVSWQAPDDGGSPISGYTVATTDSYGRSEAGCTTTGATTCVVSSLENFIGVTFTVQATNGVGPGPASDPSSTVIPKVSGDWYQPVAPTRILDSRPESQVGPYATAWGEGETRPVAVAGTGGIPADATAVALNVTVTDTTSSSFLTVWPAGQDKPVASSLNWVSGETVPNAVTVQVGADGDVDVYNRWGSADVVVDVVGWYGATTASGFSFFESTRVMDSRPDSQVGPYSTPWGQGETREVEVGGDAALIPPDTTAVVLNVTVTNPDAAGFLTVWADGSPQPLASSLNWSIGETTSNSVTVPVSAGGAIDIYNRFGTVDVVVDAVGAFSFGTQGHPFHALAPVRILDTRPDSVVGPDDTPLGDDDARQVQVADLDGVPTGEDVLAALTNVTVTNTDASSYLAVWPGPDEYEGGSSLNWQPGETVANAVTAVNGFSDYVWMGNAFGNVDVIVDMSGWYG